MADNFNYFDELRTGNAQQWISYLNGKFMDLTAPSIRIFKLDKEKTILDELHGETAFGRSRIYLPPFEIRAFHLDNTWRQVLGEGTLPYLETQENIQFILNLEQMVAKIRDLKSRHISELKISYSGSQHPTAIKEGDLLTVKINDTVYQTYDLTNSLYNTTKKLASAINTLSNFSVEFVGENDASVSLVSFNETRFRHAELIIFSEDETYRNSTEVIESGDLVLTNKWFLYEVLSNQPGGNFGWDYSTFIITCNIRSLDKAQLPGNFNEQIREHEYSLRDKIELE